MANDISLKETNLTEGQQVFVENVGNGLSPTKAAEVAGYHFPRVEAHRLLLLPHVQRAIFNHRQRKIVTVGGSIGLAGLIELAQDKACPAPVRFQANKWLAEAAGHGQTSQAKPGGAGKHLSEMTADELRETMVEAKRAMDAVKPGDRAPVSAEIIEVEPSEPSVS